MFLRGQWREALAKQDIAYAKYVSRQPTRDPDEETGMERRPFGKRARDQRALRVRGRAEGICLVRNCSIRDSSGAI
jgi:hypothetical protein